MLSASITSLFEQGLRPAEIAEQLGLDRETVEFELIRQKKISQEDIPESRVRNILDRLCEIAESSANEHVAVQAGKFIVEQARGSAKLRGAPQINLLQINQSIQQGMAEAQQLLKEATVEVK